MAPEMTAAAIVEIIQILESAGIDVWLDGGWAVDALLGEQTRPHKDADLIVPCRQVPSLMEVLSNKGYTIQPGGTPANFVLADQSGLEVDVHAITVGPDGNGLYQMANGEDWLFPAAGFHGSGVISGTVVRCLTAEVQVQCHAHGYVPSEKDLRDMELLHLRFGVALPRHLRRDAT